MLTKIVKFAAIATLLLTVIFWNYVLPFQLAVRFIVAFGAVVVASQALKTRKFYWATGFFLIALLFNPFVLLISLPSKLALAVVLAMVVPFTWSFRALKDQPLLSIPSITDRVPGSRSL